MASFSLELHPDKTRLIEFGRFAQKNRRAEAKRVLGTAYRMPSCVDAVCAKEPPGHEASGVPKTVDFLGFTHYCRTTRHGKFGLGRKPVGKRVDRTLRRIGAELNPCGGCTITHMRWPNWLGKIL